MPEVFATDVITCLGRDFKENPNLGFTNQVEDEFTTSNGGRAVEVLVTTFRDGTRNVCCHFFDQTNGTCKAGNGTFLDKDKKRLAAPCSFK